MNTTPVQVKLTEGDQSIPVTVVKNGIDKEITITPAQLYAKNKQHKLEVLINEKKYILKFKTTNS